MDSWGLVSATIFELMLFRSGEVARVEFTYLIRTPRHNNAGAFSFSDDDSSGGAVCEQQGLNLPCILRKGDHKGSPYVLYLRVMDFTSHPFFRTTRGRFGIVEARERPEDRVSNGLAYNPIAT